MLVDRDTEQEQTDRDYRPDHDESAPEPPRSRRKLWFGLGIAAVVIGAAGLFAYFHYQGRVSTDNAQVDGHIVPVASKIYGTVAEVLVKDNQLVKAGQVLVRIDPRDYQTRVDQAKAALAYAESQARGASAGVPLTTQTTASGTSEALAQVSAAEADLARARSEFQRASTAEIAQAQANVTAAQAQAERAQADLNRMRPLVEKEEISRQQFDAYVAAARVASSQLNAAQQQLEATRQGAESRRAAVTAAQAKVAQANAGVASSRANQGQVAVRAAEVGSANAGIQQARANLEAAQLQLSYSTIVAQTDGLVTRKNVEPGQIVQQGQALMTIIPLNDIWVTANFKETQLRGVKVGQRCEIKIDLDGRKYEGHVDSIAGATGARMSLLPPENATGNFVKVVQRIPVKIYFDHVPPDALLRPGMNAEATIFVK